MDRHDKSLQIEIRQRKFRNLIAGGMKVKRMDKLKFLLRLVISTEYYCKH